MILLQAHSQDAILPCFFPDLNGLNSCGRTVDLMARERRFLWQCHVKNWFSRNSSATPLGWPISARCSMTSRIYYISCNWRFSFTTSTAGNVCIECVLSSRQLDWSGRMAKGMTVLFRSLTCLKHLQRCRQLAVGRRGLRVASGGDARSVASVIDHGDETTLEGKPTFSSTTVYDEAREKIDTTFENAKAAFTSKTNFELLRSYTVFQMCSVKLFVNKNKQVRRIQHRLMISPDLIVIHRPMSLTWWPFLN